MIGVFAAWASRLLGEGNGHGLHGPCVIMVGVIGGWLLLGLVLKALQGHMMGDGCSHVIALVGMYEDRLNDSIAWLAPGHVDHFTLPTYFLWNVNSKRDGSLDCRPFLLPPRYRA